MPINMVLSPMQRDQVSGEEFGEFKDEFRDFRDEFYALDSYVKDGFKKVFEQADNIESTLISRIDGVENRLSTRIDTVESNLGEKIDRVESKIDSISAQVTLLTKVVNNAIK
jgi:gas vesicle protein